MLYWKNDTDLDYCKFCAEVRYKSTRERNPNRKKTRYAILMYLAFTPHLQRLYAPKATTEQMMWHANHQTVEGSMCHSSDTEAWRHFYRIYPDFVVEPRIVRLSLCMDGFVPHGHYGCTYSCWLIILTPYYLPPRMCMSSKYMFLTMVILGPSNKKCLIDVYLKPLIDELQNLWYVDVLTYDNAKNKIFTIHGLLMWIVNDLPAYGMASGWSTISVIGCLTCMDDTRALYLQNGRKTCYFDCHRQFLHQDHLYRRNKKAFTNNRVERKVARLRLMGEQIHDWIVEFSPAVEILLALPPRYGSEHKWRKKNIFLEFEY
ncbi:hypothetical protein Sango_1190400 [Sesamum angolense]|uniref:Uncharacterized protein n=1 Tax=Sesamum angolense TaxID=2727404 RepID=A0AAE1WX00_9LAMI|nr:hypothetical protein Sango_1190400 [Sesamum angolense]